MDSHVSELNAFAQALEAEKGKPIPRFDPLDGGNRARLLVLMESPSRRGIERGYASSDNPTPTGRRMRETFAAAGIRREDRVIWNAVPWYLGDDRKGRNPTAAELREGALYLPPLLKLLPELRVVLTLGVAAEKGWKSLNSELPHIAAPHPSNTNLCARPWLAAEFRRAVEEAADAIRQRP